MIWWPFIISSLESPNENRYKKKKKIKVKSNRTKSGRQNINFVVVIASAKMDV